MRILVAEDDKDMNRLITKRLKMENYSVDSCYNGKEVFEYLSCAEYDGIVLDDGLQVLRKLRNKGNLIPVLLLTVRDSIQDRVNGLDAGADDYLVKPFAFEELLARIRVMLRILIVRKQRCFIKIERNKIRVLEKFVGTQDKCRNFLYKMLQCN